MSSKIFKAIWIAAITVFLASLLLIMGTLYDYFSSLQRNQLRNQTELAAQGVAMSGMDYLDELSIENYRITWVSLDGNVLFDNEGDSENLPDIPIPWQISSTMLLKDFPTGRFSVCQSLSFLYGAFSSALLNRYVLSSLSH